MATSSTNTEATITTTTTSTTTNLYEYIASYDFSSDLEFRKGLGTILGHPETPASDSELLRDDNIVLQAKCFYISKKKNVAPPINAASFQNWLIENKASAASHAAQQLATEDSNQQQQQQPEPSSKSSTNDKDAEPTYPSSFAHIVELITTGQPVPGIEEIPDTVLSGHEKPSKVERRRKPWEKLEEETKS
ncbi:hypothetical protein PISL3812_03723 [Talaromyces islandicus]|uniref:Uncharacterized protein n=1 Tax=Talaromyces islandicus TaxID=28573 RepID=A0A0U1LTG8_TALIS|nr:hypothetical protein PISL3812_03723 [Talaromyces islandicus]